MNTEIAFFNVGIILRALALLLFLVRVFPIQYKEYKLGNGLKKYRKALFVFGIMLFVSTLVPFIITIFHVFGDQAQVGRGAISFFNSLNDFIIILMMYLIYNFKGGEK